MQLSESARTADRYSMEPESEDPGPRGDISVAMLDSGRYSGPYDVGLCRALIGEGVGVTLHTRPPRAGEAQESLPEHEEADFYRLSERLRRRGVPAVIAQVLRLLEHPFDLIGLWRRLRTERPDIVHYQWLVVPALDGILIRLWRRSPVVVTVHNTNPLHGVSVLSPRRLGMNWAMKGADALIVHTRFSIGQLESQGVNTPASIVPIGVEIQPACPSRPAAADEPLNVLMFGRVCQYKGADVLVRAVGLVPAEVRTALKVVIAGTPQVDVESLLALADEVGASESIEWHLEFIPEEKTRELFCAADVVALPYRDVDGSAVMAQALGFGVPVVASDLAGFREVVEDGSSGRLFRVDDPASLANVLTEMIRDRSRVELMARRQRELGAAASWPAVGAKTRRVYENLIRRRGESRG
ncbi:MAG TPA: glycosyltransferase [Acidimicrobiales bacterium]|nr:glycosyltransferase [Acidimicrobiales bacterium]